LKDSEILFSALKFIENSAVMRSIDDSSKSETFRAIRGLHKITISSYNKQKILIIDSVQIRNTDTEEAIWTAMRKRWMETSDSDEKKLQRFRDDVKKIATINQINVNTRQNQREDRERQK
jgi:hypothetical protein